MEEPKNNQDKEEQLVTLKQSEYLGLLEEVKKGKDSWDVLLRLPFFLKTNL